MSQRDVIDFSALERELQAAVASERRYQQENDAKLRAVTQRVSYEQFRWVLEGGQGPGEQVRVSESRSGSWRGGLGSGEYVSILESRSESWRVGQSPGEQVRVLENRLGSLRGGLGPTEQIKVQNNRPGPSEKIQDPENRFWSWEIDQGSGQTVWFLYEFQSVLRIFQDSVSRMIPGFSRRL